MFYLGLAAVLLVALLLGLTVLRLLDSRPSPNAELLAGLLDDLDRAVPEDHAPHRTASLPPTARHA